MNSPQPTSISSTQSRFAVVRVDRHYRLLATTPIQANEKVLRFEGEVRPVASRYSVQVGLNRHLELPDGTTTEEMLDRYPWCFLNHSCAPNCRIDGFDLIALRAIQPWEQLCFDYTTTEAKMAEAFVCGCGADNCLGAVSGFHALTAQQREARAATTAPWLLHPESQTNAD